MPLRSVRHAASLLVKLDVIGKLVTLSEREAGELRDVAAADAGRSTTRRDLSLLLERGLRTKTTVALSRAEARDLAELLTRGGFGSNLALLREAPLGPRSSRSLPAGVARRVEPDSQRTPAARPCGC